MKMFADDPRAYGDADLALGGACPVCRVDGGGQVAGNPQFETMSDGLRYRFSTAEMRDRFLDSPEKYRVR